MAPDMLPECLMCLSLAVVCGCQTERAGDTVNAVVQLYVSFFVCLESGQDNSSDVTCK